MPRCEHIAAVFSDFSSGFMKRNTQRNLHDVTSVSYTTSITMFLRGRGWREWMCTHTRSRPYVARFSTRVRHAGSMSRVVYIWIILHVSTPSRISRVRERYLWFNSVILSRPCISLSDCRRRAFIHVHESHQIYKTLIKYKPRETAGKSLCETSL